MKSNKNRMVRRLVIIIEIMVFVTIVACGFIFWKKDQIMMISSQQAYLDELVQKEEMYREEYVLEKQKEQETLEDLEENTIKPNEIASEEEEVVLLFGGDILFDESYAVMNSVKNNSEGVVAAFSDEILEEMRGADIFMVNNEFTYTERGIPTEGKTYTFRAKPESANYLHDLGVDLVSIANNHTYDYGEISLLDTMEALNQAKIAYVGAGINIEEAKKPVYFTVNDIKIAFIAATQIERYDNPDTKGATATTAGVFRCFDVEPLLEVIAEAKKESDFVVVFPHWGTENETMPDWAQLDQAPKMVEAGADLIVGAHPHVLQGITYVENTPVAYSMGNLWFNSFTMDNGLLKVILDKQGIKSLQFLPGLQSGCKTSLQEGDQKDRVIDDMQRLSVGITIDKEGFIYKNQN